MESGTQVGACCQTWVLAAMICTGAAASSAKEYLPTPGRVNYSADAVSPGACAALSSARRKHARNTSCTFTYWEASQHRQADCKGPARDNI